MCGYGIALAFVGCMSTGTVLRGLAVMGIDIALRRSKNALARDGVDIRRDWVPFRRSF